MDSSIADRWSQRPQTRLKASLYFVGLAHWLAFFLLVFPTGDGSVIHSLGSGGQGGIINFETGGQKALLRTPVQEWFQLRRFTAHDMYKEFNYLLVVKEALSEGVLPYHVPAFERVLPKANGRFLGSPIWTMSPQVVLLLILSPSLFFVVNTLAMYTVGFWGCVLLARYLSLGGAAFSFLFLLFNFNGFFVEKMAAYGPSYMGHFLVPYILLLLLKVTDRGRESVGFLDRDAIWMGIALAAILYQGTLHYFTQAVAFFMIWAVFKYRHWRFSFAAMAVMGAVSMARLLPTFVNFGGGGNNTRWVGYPSADFVMQALVVTPRHISEPIFAWWEYSMYVGPVAFLFICYFALWGPLLEFGWYRRDWRAFGWPMAVMALLSIGNIKHAVVPDWLPFFNVEGRPSNFMFLPLLTAVVIASANLDGFVEKYRTNSKAMVAVVLGVALAGWQLFNHSRYWFLHRVQAEFDWIAASEIWGPQGIKPAVDYKIVNDMGDQLYIYSVHAGLLISLVAFLALMGWIYATRTHRKLGDYTDNAPVREKT